MQNQTNVIISLLARMQKARRKPIQFRSCVCVCVSYSFWGDQFISDDGNAFENTLLIRCVAFWYTI